MTPLLEKKRLPAVAVSPPDGFAVGAVLNDTYRIIRRLAEGGFGEVYLAAHTRLPGGFAVKLLHKSMARDGEALARFRQEAEITSTLRHPHIVQVFDFNVTNTGLPYLVMELLDGQSLSQLMAPGLPLRPRRAIAIVEQIAQALHVAHERGIVHRDLKPDNVMLLSATGAEDFVKVLDFGISKASWRTRLTQNDTVSGTPQYMSPEQARGQREEVDHRSDQFSLAGIAYTLFTGREPFVGDDPVTVLYQVVHEDPRAPAAVNPALGAHVDAVIMRGLSKDPASRYADVLEFAGALRAAIGDSGGAASVGVSDDTRPVLAEAADEPGFVAEVGAEQDAEQDSLPPAGRETKRLIRRVRRRLHRPMHIVVLVLVAGLGVAAWFCPATRGTTRASWHKVEHEVGGLISRVDSRRL
jgi:serine/threonine protein kinase